jgi:GNAT superfamily N-acetyltransferase
MINIIPVTTKKQRAEFIDFPHDLYMGDPNYVPELFVAQDDLLNPNKHPFYLHSSAQLFLAYKDNKIVGRIAAIWNPHHNEFNKVNEGQFGFFDCINDQEVANKLFDTAKAWVKEKGGDKIVGPINLSTNETCGLLIEGFDRPPVAMMTYNYPYYMDLIENYGFTKQVDLRAYEILTENANTRSVLLLDKLEERLKRSGIILRLIDLKNFKSEAEKIKKVYNKAWDKNLGFVPMTDEEFAYIAKDLKMIVDPNYCIIAEKDNEIVGFAVGIPNINEIQIKIKRGRLLPTGIFKLLFGRKKIKTLRVMMLGVLEEYRKLGIEACLYGRIIKNAKQHGIKGAECSWMLDHNYMMNHAIEQINGNLYKRYRIYEKLI